MFGTLASKVNFRLLEIFVRVAEEGTMSAAADQLQMSQAAVSQAVAALEDLLTVKLFDRSVRPPALTLLGKSALKSATEILVNLRELEDSMRYGASGRVPLLRIGMLDSFTSTAGPSFLEQLRDVAREWTVVSGFKATCFQALVERRSDAIITSDDSAVPDDVDARPILTETFLLAVPLRHNGKVTDMKTVVSELEFIRYGRASHMGAGIDDYLRRVGVQPTPRYQFDTTDAALRMVAAGFGWTIVTPMIFLKSMVPQGMVRLVPLSGAVLRRNVTIAMRRSESGELLRRMRSAALHTLREVVLPQIAELLPEHVDKFVIPKDLATKERAGARKVA